MSKLKKIVQYIKEVISKHFLLILSFLAFMFLGSYGFIIHTFFTVWFLFMWIFSIYQNQILILFNKYILRFICLLSLVIGTIFFTKGHFYHLANQLTLGVIFLISSLLLLLADLINNKKNNEIKS